MLSKIASCGVAGINGYIVDVETDISNGIPSFEIVGLGDAAVRESKERVRAALRHSGFEFPMKRITVNLAPANMRKEGSAYDLPIAIGILVASGQFRQDVCNGYAFLGELSMDGSVKPVKGVLSMAYSIKQSGLGHIAVAADNAMEAAIIEDICVFGAGNIVSLTDHLTGKKVLQPYKVDRDRLMIASRSHDVDFADVRGQQNVKRALEVAVSGAHNLIMVGSPGSGKTMIAKRIPAIIPPLTFDEAIEVTKIYSITGLLPRGIPLITCRPFRAPHHSITNAGLIGGGMYPVPGEISLAHLGVLFLDEFPEFRQSALEALRQPVEEGSVTIARHNASVQFPASIMLICAANPCRCGYRFDKGGRCTCTRRQLQDYQSRISGPLMDRIDIQIEVGPIKYGDIDNAADSECSSAIRKRVHEVRQLQIERYKSKGFFFNSQLPQSMLRTYCELDNDSRKMMKNAFERLALSARAYSRILKVARTIADMESSEDIRIDHMGEAIQYRNMDRKRLC